MAAILLRQGIRYRRNVKSLPGSPDFASKKGKWAIFVMGCFWHQHRGCRRATLPKRNHTFWVEKFAANRRRDAAKIKALRAGGVRVYLIWECQVSCQDKISSIALDIIETRCI